MFDTVRLVYRIGVAEKGYIMVELSVQTSAGHSSMPPRESSIGILSNAVTKWVYNYKKGFFAVKEDLDKVGYKMAHSFPLRMPTVTTSIPIIFLSLKLLSITRQRRQRA